MKKCVYCAKEITYFEQYCCDECQAKTNKYYETEEKFGKLFSVINVICVFGIPIGMFLFSFAKLLGAMIAACCCVVLGVMLLFLPFPTEGMIIKHKLKKAMKITRIIGMAVIGFGFVIVGFLFFFFM